jgi:hypothetical protein
LCEIKPVKVHLDCHVTIAGSYYSVPFRYVGQTLDAHIGERVVQLFCGQELVASHERSQEPGIWHTRLGHYPPDKAAYLENTPARCREIAARVGPATVQVVESLLAERPLDRLRSVQGILRLQKSVGPARLERACARAIHYDTVSYRQIKAILNAALDQEPLPGEVQATPKEHFAFARSPLEFFAPVQEEV